MKIRQNKMMGYLAVTAGVGCAASVAEGAIVVVNLSGLSTVTGFKTLPVGGGSIDFSVPPDVSGGGYLRGVFGQFYSDGMGIITASQGRGYGAAQSAAFPSDPDPYVYWRSFGITSGSGFSIGENWVAFKDSTGKYGWMSFTLNSLGANTSNPITSFGKFVYDPASNSPANAITLQAAVAAAVPEPSSLVLLALGATGLAARRQRRNAA